jgi:hypothetical protein
MHPARQARCAAVLTEPETLRATAVLELVDGRLSVLRAATLVYAVSPNVPNANEALAAGLKGRIEAWKRNALSVA